MKNVVYVILVVLAVTCVFSISTIISYKNRGKTDNHAVAIAMNDTVAHHFDDAGRDHGEQEELISDLRTALAIKGRLFDSVCKAINVKPKNVNSISAVSTETSGNIIFLTDTVYVDSGKHKILEIRYADKWINLNGVIGSNMLHYDVFDSIIVTSYNRKSGFLNTRSTPYMDAYSINPHTHIKGLTGIKIESMRTKKFSLGFGIGYGFNGSRFEPQIGLSLHYSLFRF